jgi:hypothetical protein
MDDPTDDAAAEATNAFPIEQWNKVVCDEVLETDSDQEAAAGIPEIVFKIENEEEFDGKYGCIDGLSAVPRLSSRKRGQEDTPQPPTPLTAHTAGKYEASLRVAMKFERNRLLATLDTEPD